MVRSSDSWHCFINGNFFMDSLPSDENMLSVGASKRADGRKRRKKRRGHERS